jgi:hypothetical protein
MTRKVVPPPTRFTKFLGSVIEPRSQAVNRNTYRSGKTRKGAVKPHKKTLTMIQRILENSNPQSRSRSVSRKRLGINRRPVAWGNFKV